ncbi:MAG: 4Fe-4S dicluster domain-containing protein [Saccharofermentanales bacterium]|jgi:anaerobic dimethyl sulfoxide reductase subunit B (iron-sulfur subunit)|nr:4Fe-4S binding protein [Clostridiaceae bacterium]
MKYVFVLDESKCVACSACAVACMDQNDIDPLAGDIPFRAAFVDEQGPVEDPKFTFLSIACMHCENAPCMIACPTGCLKKDPETGFTVFDNTNCIGCHSCAMACPFAQPCFNDNSGKMTKCDGCVERVKRGMQPACVKVCPFGALSLVSESEYQELMRTDARKKISYKILD